MEKVEGRRQRAEGDSVRVGMLYFSIHNQYQTDVDLQIDVVLLELSYLIEKAKSRMETRI